MNITSFLGGFWVFWFCLVFWFFFFLKVIFPLGAWVLSEVQLSRKTFASSWVDWRLHDQRENFVSEEVQTKVNKQHSLQVFE